MHVFTNLVLIVLWTPRALFFNDIARASCYIARASCQHGDVGSSSI